MSVANLKNYNPTKGKIFLFDANIWIALCWPDYQHFSTNHSDLISTFLDKCIKMKCKILLPSIVVSEIINRIFRNEHKLYSQNNHPLNYKDFRKTTAATDVIKDIRTVFLSQLIRLEERGVIEKIEDSFFEFSISTALEQLNQIDFNDLLILEICKKQDIYLVTNDSDLLKMKETIPMLTSLY